MLLHVLITQCDRISDPFLDMNELDAIWVGETAWTYRTTFDSPTTDGATVHLVFEGLDTFAQISLNNTVILEADNMFLSHRVDITKHLQDRDLNTLVINFDSALLKGRELQKEYPNHRWELFNGEASRLAVRKAQYHWVRTPFATGDNLCLPKPGMGLGAVPNDCWPLETCLS